MNNITLASWEDNWDSWIEKYIAPGTRTNEYELMVETIGPDIYHFPLFTDAFCEEIIAKVEEGNLWTTERHEFYPTTDVLLTELGLYDMYHKVLEEFCHPIARQLWRLEGKRWFQTMEEESFMARYRAEEQQLLSIHQDYADYTFTVGLNSEFEGGGTWFSRQQVLANPKGGYCSLFPCITHPHGGRPTTEGTRYILVSFCRRSNLYTSD
ncbi:MAG: hypothetical protein AB8D52_10930 [Gammaproteobacteria bacterium]